MKLTRTWRNTVEIIQVPAIAKHQELYQRELI